MNKTFTSITLAIAGAACLTPLTAHAQESWKSLGTTEFRESFIHSQWEYSAYPILDVEIQESEQTDGRYRLVNPYANYPSEYIGNNSPGCLPGDYYIVVDASDPRHVFIETSNTGYLVGVGENADGEDESMVLWAGSIAYDYYQKYGNWTLAEAEGICGTLRDGYITFPIRSLIGIGLFKSYHDAGYVPDDSGDFLWRLVANDKFRLKLPGASKVIDNSIEFLKIDDDHTTLTYQVNLDDDIQNARVAILEGEFDEAMYDKVINGEVDYKEVTESGPVTFPYTADGIVTAVVVPYFDGHDTYPAYVTHELAYDESEWRKTGYATFTESIMSSNELTPYGEFVYGEVGYEVQVEESVAHPGYIRLVDPYGPGYPYYSSSSYDHTRKWYVYIDATDPAAVIMEYCDNVGANMGAGNMKLWCRADKYLQEGTMTEVQIKAANLYGRFADNHITFPAQSLLILFSPNPTTWYWANNNGHFDLAFKEGQLNGRQDDGSGVDNIAADVNDAPEVYYTLDGRKVGSTNPAPGIYIVRKGAESYKRVIR